MRIAFLICLLLSTFFPLSGFTQFNTKGKDKMPFPARENTPPEKTEPEITSEEIKIAPVPPLMERNIFHPPLKKNSHTQFRRLAPTYVQWTVDVTACPQGIAYPTDLGLLNAGRMKCEEIIDSLYDPLLHGPVKPRTYREKARKAYLNTAKKKKKTRAELKVAIGKQLRYVNRDLKTIDRLLCAFSENPFKEKERNYVETIRKVLVQ
jgi:hypothetical protein